MRITEDTTIGELMQLLRDSIPHLSQVLDYPMPNFTVFQDGSFEITESFYEVSATCNSTIRQNNEFTSHSVAKIIENRLLEKEQV